MAKPIWAGFLSAIVLAFICGGLYAFTERTGVANATLSKEDTIVGVDANPTGNDASHVGTINSCVSVFPSPAPPNETFFYVDLFVKDVTNIYFWEGSFSYDPSVLDVVKLDVKGFFLGDNVYEAFLDCSAGVCQVATFDTTTPTPLGHSGSGVLGRLKIKPKAIGTSKLYFTLWKSFGMSGVILKEPTEPDETFHGDLDGDSYFDGLVFNAIVVVDNPANPKGCPTDYDKDGFTNDEESVDGSDLMDAASTPEICDGQNNDQDGMIVPGGLGVIDEWYDRAPVNGIPDCQELPSGDDDNDGFTDAQEIYLHTDTLANCPGHPYHDPWPHPYHSAWPLDINNDGAITVANDVFNFAGLIGTGDGDGMFRKRLDLNGDGRITVANDVFQFAGNIGRTCS